MSAGVIGKSKIGEAAGLTRRGFMIGLPLALAACQTTTTGTTSNGASVSNSTAASMYGPVPNEPFPIPAVDLSVVNPIYYRQIVPVPPNVPNNPGQIVVDPYNHFLYLVLADNLAQRYGVGVGRAGFGWAGRASIQRKAEWPTWTPTAAMIERDPAARPWAGGMPPGLSNPLGARALYLYRGGVDTMYRLHGTPEAWSIGQSVSSGCIRLLNQDIIHLYSLTPVGTSVTVLSG
jgi:lipoprotein-anchoring transpeptidase ErfK/SrfK